MRIMRKRERELSFLGAKEEELKNEDIDRYVEKILRTLGNRCGITMRE